MIFSGGQGGDETVPEGPAMLENAIAHGLPATDGWGGDAIEDDLAKYGV